MQIMERIVRSMIKKLIFAIFSLSLVLFGVKNEIAKQKMAKNAPKKEEIKPERVSSSKMEKIEIQKVIFLNKNITS